MTRPPAESSERPRTTAGARCAERPTARYQRDEANSSPGVACTSCVSTTSAGSATRVRSGIAASTSSSGPSTLVESTVSITTHAEALEYISMQASAETRRAYRRDLSKWFDFIGDKALDVD